MASSTKSRRKAGQHVPFPPKECQGRHFMWSFDAQHRATAPGWVCQVESALSAAPVPFTPSTVQRRGPGVGSWVWGFCSAEPPAKRSLSHSRSFFRKGRGRGSDPLPRRFAPPQIIWGSQVKAHFSGKPGAVRRATLPQASVGQSRVPELPCLLDRLLSQVDQ